MRRPQAIWLREAFSKGSGEASLWPGSIITHTAGRRAAEPGQSWKWEEDVAQGLGGYCPSGKLSSIQSVLDAKCQPVVVQSTLSSADSIFFGALHVVFHEPASYKQNSPYDRYCCYINQSQGRWDQQTSSLSFAQGLLLIET